MLLKEGKSIIDLLPAEQAGKCLLTESGALVCGGLNEIQQALHSGKCSWHSGSIGGVIPNIVE